MGSARQRIVGGRIVGVLIGRVVIVGLLIVVVVIVGVGIGVGKIVVVVFVGVAIVGGAR